METKTLRELVIRDFRSADVFKKYHLNYCCSSNLPLAEVCQNERLDLNQVIADLNWISREMKMPSDLGYEAWPLDFLVDYVANVYHAYLFKTIPMLGKDLMTYAKDHPRLVPEVLKTIGIYEKLASMVISQNIEEEKIIFPYIKQLHSAFIQRETYGMLFVKTLRKPFTDMEKSLALTTALMAELDAITSHFMIPDNGCTMYKVLIQKIQQVYHILSEHHRIENKFLFPRALRLERLLLEL